MLNWPDKQIEFTEVKGLNFQKKEGRVVGEVPVALSVNGKLWVTLMCTPVDVDALAVGFLFNENIIDSIKDVKHIEVHTDTHLVEVWLNKDVEKPDDWRITSGCTGGVSAVIDILKYSADRKMDGYRISPNEVISLTKKLIDYQGLHQEVGGTHASALSNGEDLIVVCEDIGRHNTIDKLIGKIMFDDIEIKRKILLTTGRVSSEMLQKTARVGALMIISLTSPTSLSIEMAQEIGITLIGYARGMRFNIYSHPERILISANEKPVKT